MARPALRILRFGVNQFTQMMSIFHYEIILKG